MERWRTIELRETEKSKAEARKAEDSTKHMKRSERKRELARRRRQKRLDAEVLPTPETHATLTVLKAGERVYDCVTYMIYYTYSHSRKYV